MRDWSYPYEAKYGEKGGSELLEKRLRVSIVVLSKLGCKNLSHIMFLSLKVTLCEVKATYSLLRYNLKDQETQQVYVL